MAGQRPYDDRLDDLAAGLERLNAVAKVKAPEYEELQHWLDEARSLVAEILANDRAPAFAEDPSILAEGEFLKAQLTGVEGTVGVRPLFKAAVEIRLSKVRGEPPEPHAKPSG